MIDTLELVICKSHFNRSIASIDGKYDVDIERERERERAERKLMGNDRERVRI
jgi:hypothetical protein